MHSNFSWEILIINNPDQASFTQAPVVIMLALPISFVRSTSSNKSVSAPTFIP